MPPLYLLTDQAVQILSKEYCIQSLIYNLRAETPHEVYKLHEEPKKLSTLFCVGFNHTYDLTSDHFVRIHNGGRFRRMKATISDELRPHRINGGAFCYGDSGGPLWVYDTTQKVPVQMGVYSYMPWGSCSGAHETGFFADVPQFLDWIFQYVPEDQVCKPS